MKTMLSALVLMIAVGSLAGCAKHNDESSSSGGTIHMPGYSL